MFALIRKDLIACRLFLFIGLGFYALWAACTYRQPLGYFALNVGATMVLILAPLVVDDKYRAETLVCFLPPSRSKAVLARYAMALVALLVGFGAQYGLGAILNIRAQEAGYQVLCAPQAVLAFCAVPVTLVALYIPCFFRFGLGRGSLAFAVLMIALTTLLTSPLIATFLFSPSSDFVLTREMLQHPETALVALIDHAASAVGSVRFYAAVPIGGIALVAGSVATSIWFHNRRDF
ncbi:MAG: ABC-2 transporter permease [Pirellulaceae bacterium]|jgi:hypothetical protein|nr:ABC-2 transporter permease [Pirellulaceae bacterium]